jgi:hypothetical protein
MCLQPGTLTTRRQRSKVFFPSRKLNPDRSACRPPNADWATDIRLVLLACLIPLLHSLPSWHCIHLLCSYFMYWWMPSSGDVTPCGSCKNLRFVGTVAFIIRVKKIGELGTTLAVTTNWSTLRRNTVNVVSRSPALFALMTDDTFL